MVWTYLVKCEMVRADMESAPTRLANGLDIFGKM